MASVVEDGRPLQVELSLVPTTYDVDFAGIVHNLVYIRWLEDLRLQILANYMPVAEMLATGVGPILTKTTIEYRSPLRLGDEALGCMWVEELRRTSWTISAEILLGQELVATAQQKGFFASMETLRPVAVPQPLYDAWERSRL